MKFLDPDAAFAHAIATGALNENPRSHEYAGNWMYMGTDEAGTSAFKNINTRKYLYVTQTQIKGE